MPLQVIALAKSQIHLAGSDNAAQHCQIIDRRLFWKKPGKSAWHKASQLGASDKLVQILHSIVAFKTK